MIAATDRANEELDDLGGLARGGPAHLSVAVTIEGSMHHPPANLETLSIEPDKNRACFTWRSAVPCDRRALKVQTIVVSRAGAGARS